MNQWQENIPSEVAYWDAWLREQGGVESAIFQRRIDRNSLLIPMVDDAVRTCKHDTVRILDVGCGPISDLGYRAACGKTLSIHYVDPLANQYSASMRAAGISAPHSTLEAKAEDLLEWFSRQSFDVVFCMNALDHCENALLSLVNMVYLLAPGGACILHHRECEGKRNNYEGLHRWDLSYKEGQLFLDDRVQAINVSRWLGSLVSTDIHVCENDWFTATLKRKP